MISAEEQENIDSDKREREKELEDLKFVLKSAEGRRVYRRMLSHCQTFHMSFVTGMPDITAFNEGRRSVGNFMLFELLDADPERYHQIMREFKSSLVAKEMIRENKEK